MTHDAGSPSTTRAQLDVLGSKLTVLVPAEDVGGAYSIVEEIDEPGAGSPPHANTRETLAITVVDGDLEVVLPGRSVKLGPGESISPPRGVRHSTRNVGSVPSRTLFTFVPGGFERFFVEVAALGEGGAQDMDRVAEIAAAYGMQIAPPEEG